ncbi:MAG: glycerophosphodiester phosphodiesterase [Clostridia bacterium]|nr:glycerophosphodiester phosphodiesterase [Clostridia bacterium]
MINIIAHRGANKVAPQNTIPAFKKAIEMNADGFENDVHLTKDGIAVVCHNYDIDQTSDGTGFIADYTYEELLQFDFGSYFSEEFKDTKIPTLDEFYELCSDLKVINVEIKSPKDKNFDIVEKTIDSAKKYNLQDKLLISSFDPEVLLKVKDVDPTVKTGILYDPNSPIAEEICDDVAAYAKKIKVDALHPYIAFLSEDYIEEAHEAGLIVNPWTVNKDFQIENLCRWGCDGVITDVPDFAREIAEKTEQEK